MCIKQTSNVQNAAIARMFSPGVIKPLALTGKSPLFAELAHQANFHDVATLHTVGDVFNYGFKRLRRNGMRNEYIYQSAIVQNILLGRHSLRTASMMREFRTGDSRADIVVLNGTSTVYELKSERDTLQRLEKQVNDYSSVFARTFVVASEKHIDDILALVPSNVGVMSLVRWNRIRTVRDAEGTPSGVQPAKILASLRRAEAVSILEHLRIAPPTVPNTQMFDALADIFSTQEPAVIHNAMLYVLKKSRSQTSLRDVVNDLPASLKAAAIMYNLNKTCTGALVRASHTSLEDTLNWT